MGTIPAPNIVDAAGGIAQAPMDALSEYSRAVALQRQAQVSQAQASQVQAQTQGIGIENQVKQQQLQDMQTLRQLAPKYVQKDDQGKITGFDFPGFTNDATSKGVNPSTVAGLAQNWAKSRTDLANAAKAERENHDAVNSNAGDLLESIKSLTDPVQRQRAYDSAVAHMQHNGLDTSNFPQQVPTDNKDLDVLEVPLGIHKQVIAEAKTQAETTEAAAKARNENAQAAFKELENKGLLAFTPEYVSKQVDSVFPPNDPATGGANRILKNRVLGQLQAGDPLGAKQTLSEGFKSAMEVQKDVQVQTNPQIQAGKEAVAKANAQNRINAQVGNFGEPGDPMIDMVGQNRVDLNSVLSRVPPLARVKFLDNLNAAYPNYDQSEFKLAMDSAKKARAGAWADSRLAYNTAVDHSDLLLSAAKALDNGDVKALNDLKNKFGTAFGSSGPITYAAIANAYNHEVTSVISKGHITDTEVGKGNETLPSDVNLSTIQSVVGAYKALMNSKRDEMDKLIKATSGNKADQVLKVTPGTPPPTSTDFKDQFPKH